MPSETGAARIAFDGREDQRDALAYAASQPCTAVGPGLVHRRDRDRGATRP